MDKFAFIGHPIDLNHLYNLMGRWSFLAKRLPRHILYNILMKIPPYKYYEIKEIRSPSGAAASGFVIICPLLPQQVALLDEKIVIDKVVRAVKLAEKLGAKMAILGGFTSIVGNEGEAVSGRVDIAVTSGNTYTACLAIKGIRKAAEKMGLDLRGSTLAVIGATGDIGSICTKILSKNVKKLNMVARNEKLLREFGDSISKTGNSMVEVFKRTKDAVKEADIILTVTSAISVLIEPEDLKPGAIVCDVAIPANVAKEIAGARDDILAFEGGLAKPHFMDDIRENEWRRATPPDSIFGCLSEGILLALDGRFENYSIGRGNITEAKIEEMFGIEKKHGFDVADFFCGRKLFAADDIRDIKKNAERNRGQVYAVKR